MVSTETELARSGLQLNPDSCKHLIKMLSNKKVQKTGMSC